VEDAEEADRGAQVSGVSGDLEECCGARTKEQVVQTCGVAAAQWMECVRQREDDMDVRHVEQLTFPRREPARTDLRLTLRTVSVSTRVIGQGPMSAGATPIDMPAERRGSTPLQRAEHRALLHAQPRMPVEEVLTLRVEDIGHLHGGPTHD
jgi:hypothetical protein